MPTIKPLEAVLRGWEENSGEGNSECVRLQHRESPAKQSRKRAWLPGTERAEVHSDPYNPIWIKLPCQFNRVLLSSPQIDNADTCAQPLRHTRAHTLRAEESDFRRALQGNPRKLEALPILVTEKKTPTLKVPMTVVWKVIPIGLGTNFYDDSALWIHGRCDNSGQFYSDSSSHGVPEGLPLSPYYATSPYHGTWLLASGLLFPSFGRTCYRLAGARH